MLCIIDIHFVGKVLGEWEKSLDRKVQTTKAFIRKNSGFFDKIGKGFIFYIIPFNLKLSGGGRGKFQRMRGACVLTIIRKAAKISLGPYPPPPPFLSLVATFCSNIYFFELQKQLFFLSDTAFTLPPLSD